jgi:hypothetical protein
MHGSRAIAPSGFPPVSDIGVSKEGKVVAMGAHELRLSHPLDREIMKDFFRRLRPLASLQTLYSFQVIVEIHSDGGISVDLHTRSRSWIHGLTPRVELFCTVA